MQPTLCSKCKKNVAVVFISRQNEKGEMVNEGLCLKCAAQLGLPQVEEMMKKMGISPEDLENINNEMMQAFGGAEELSDMTEAQDDDGDDDEESGKTATFPFLNRLFGSSNPPAEKSDAPSGREETPKGRKADKKHKYLDSYCINLSQRARDGKLDAVIGREEEIQRVVQILNRRQKNNPCLIGEPGVGKTAIAEGLAQRIVAGDVPFKLRDKQVYLLDLTALVAGTQFRGQFESRMKGLIEEIRKLGNIILVIDEVHNIVGAGDAEGSMNAANILKPALSRGEIQVIGATTFNEYRKHIEKDTALERRFQPVTVNEPSLEDTLKILQGIAHYYEAYHGVSIPQGVLRQAVALSERYITDRFLPDKAIDLIDEACSDMNLHDPDINRRMEVKRDLENVTFERETLMSAQPPEGQELSQEELYNRVLCMEQIMSTGGGWQDQVGGLAPGIKMVTSDAAIVQEIGCSPCSISTETLQELNERFCLIYSGQRRLARNLLRDIVSRYVSGNPDTVEVLYEIQRIAVLMRFELEKGNVDGFAQLLNQPWELSRRLDGGCTNSCIDLIFSSVEDLIDGKMICGAGGGGFLQVILKKGVTAEQVQKRLREVFQDSGVEVWRCSLV